MYKRLKGSHVVGRLSPKAAKSRWFYPQKCKVLTKENIYDFKLETAIEVFVKSLFI